ncbi:MAG TPA: hypothetical protein VMD05_10910 [Candidatus Nanoarchaeia archaeon]|nr:hypothetical protein [Candidatus Nanoarchaeia archaeon]
MNPNSRKATALAFILLASTFMLAAFAVNTAKAQTGSQAVVILLASAGGTTSPAPNTADNPSYSYDNGTFITFSAIPDPGFAFQYWIVSGAYTPGHTGTQGGFYIDPDTGVPVQLPVPVSTSGIDSLVFTTNPANITCGYGYTYTYQAVFAPTTSTSPTPTPVPQTLTPTNTSQVVNILPSIGGTTTPAPGTYVYSNGEPVMLQATPADGFAFHYWIVSGSYTPGHQAQPTYIANVTDQYPTVPSNIYYPTIDSLVFSINPVNITCGYGYTYNYQAVFVPVNSTVPVIPTSTPIPSQQVPTTPITPTTAPPETTTAPATETATPTPAVVTPTPTPAPSNNNTTYIVIAVVVIIVIIIIAVVAAMMMRRKK